MREVVRFKRVNFAEQADAIERVLQAAVQRALTVHKKLGHSIVVWEDGKVVVIPHERIKISARASDKAE
jgi:hypothetical protein